jgi:RimJ/RimL family protein N-acetyltransferase
VIETERLILRVPIDSDLAWQQVHLNTEAVMRHLGGVQCPSDLARSFERNARAFERNEPGMFTVVSKQTGEPIGKCGLTPIETLAAPAALRGQVQIGWSLAKAAWGQGLACEAARAVIADGFATCSYACIWAQTSDSNQASTRMMARLGFERLPGLDYADPDYPPADNPTTVYRIVRTFGEGAA